MNKLTCFFSIISIFLAACSTTDQPKCGNMICTQEFRMVQVIFKDASGNPVNVKDFAAINKRTGQSTVQNNEPATINNMGNFTVASDADVRMLSEQGDAIQVSGTHPDTNKKASAEFVVSGGECACHINKVSGPEEIVF